MQFLTQTTLIHQVRTNIAIIRSRFNQNRNNLITMLTIHLNGRCLVLCLYIVHCCIDMRNDLTNIPNSLCLLCTVYLRPITLILWKIYLKVFITTCPTLQLTSTNISMLLLQLMSLSSYIKSLFQCHIFFPIYILRPCPLRLPFMFTFVLYLPSLLIFILML